jgi:hypothetical protein
MPRDFFFELVFTLFDFFKHGQNGYDGYSLKRDDFFKTINGSVI